MGGLLVVWVGGMQVIFGSLSAGQLIAFNSYLAFLLFPILSLGFLTLGMARAEASAIRIFEVLDAPIDVADKKGAIARSFVKITHLLFSVLKQLHSK